ncbi:MAG: hypothetical protein U0105_14510 [Candidatus Obscuribacterales bacterium]
MFNKLMLTLAISLVIVAPVRAQANYDEADGEAIENDKKWIKDTPVSAKAGTGSCATTSFSSWASALPAVCNWKVRASCAPVTSNKH